MRLDQVDGDYVESYHIESSIKKTSWFSAPGANTSSRPDTFNCHGYRLMTYNFDPDKWYENEVAVITSKYQSGNISKQAFEEAIHALEKKLDDMWNRLDGTYSVL